MKKTIILVHGIAGSGKNTFCDYVDARLGSCKDKLSSIIGNADAVKRIARTQYGWKNEKDERGRQLLIDVTNAGYNYDLYFWEKACKDTIERRLSNTLHYRTDRMDKFFLVNDWRYPCTFEFWMNKEDFEVVTVHITGKENNFNYSDRITMDKSEIGLKDFKFDHTIVNDGDLLDLNELAIKFVGDLI